MKKRPKTSKREKIARERRLLKSLDALDTGDGVHATVGSTSPNNRDKVNIEYVYSDIMPKLEVKTKNAKRQLKVSYSSAQRDNEQLLHLLFEKTRSQRK